MLDERDEYTWAEGARKRHRERGCFGHNPPPGTPSIPSVFDGYPTPSKWRRIGGSGNAVSSAVGGEEPAQTPEEPEDVVGAPV